MTLAKRQRTLYDVESELGKELGFQAYRAELQQRRSILESLHAASTGLRENRVNDNLKLAADKIENNQSFQIVKNQKSALHVLDIVKGGLIQAGQKVDPEESITLAMTPVRILEVQPKAQPAEGEEPEPTEVAGATAAPISPEELLANLPLGSDPLSTALNVAWESQDAVLARTRYLDENSSSQEMPRYVRLKQGILLEKQGGALQAVDVAIGEAQKADIEPARSMLGAVKEELLHSEKLIEGRVLGGTTQQFQADTMQSLDDLRRRFLPLRETIEEAAEENRRRRGADAFGRMYLLRGQDLEQAVAILHDLNHAQLLQRDVVRKVGRFLEFPPQGAALEGIEKANRAGQEHQRAVGIHRNRERLARGQVHGDLLPLVAVGRVGDELEGRVVPPVDDQDLPGHRVSLHVVVPADDVEHLLRAVAFDVVLFPVVPHLEQVAVAVARLERLDLAGLRACGQPAQLGDRLAGGCFRDGNQGTEQHPAEDDEGKW